MTECQNIVMESLKNDDERAQVEAFVKMPHLSHLACLGLPTLGNFKATLLLRNEE